VPRNHHFKINGVSWLWRYVRLKGRAAGWTYMRDPKNPDAEEKILIDERLSGRMRLNVEIHEFLHAANPTHSEEHVTQQGNDLARILWALGYRLKEGSE
jgi:hypothetical protein